MKKNNLLPYLLLTPVLLYTILLIIYPLIFSIVLSFRRFDPLTGLSLFKMKFVGWRNFVKILNDGAFLESLYNTIYMVLIGVFIQLILGLLIALLLNKLESKIKGIILTLILTPLVLPMIATGLSWRMIYHLEYGLINGILEALNIDKINFLGDPFLVKFSIIFVDTWQWTPLIILILYAGVKSLPHDIKEQAIVDGANKIQNFLFITLPLLRWYILVAILIRITDAWKMFDYISSLTGGGPGYSSQTLSYYVYLRGFRRFELGEAAAVSWIMLIIIYLICFIMVILFKPKTGEHF